MCISLQQYIFLSAEVGLSIVINVVHSCSVDLFLCALWLYDVYNWLLKCVYYVRLNAFYIDWH